MYDCYKGFALGRYTEPCCSTTADDSCSSIEKNWIVFWNSYAMLICVFCNSLNSAVQVAAAPSSKTNHYFHQLITVIFGGFFGGTLCPVVLGKIPMLLTNDYSLVWCISALVLTHYLPNSRGIMKCLLSKPVRLVWNNLFMISRSSTIFSITKTATTLIMTASATASASSVSRVVPLCGPIFAGVLVSVMGVFFPLTKGIKPISNGMPLVIQGALITSTFYHLYVHDTGICGAGMRWLLHALWSYSEYIPLVLFHLLVRQHWVFRSIELSSVLLDAWTHVTVDPVVRILPTPDICVLVVTFWFILTSHQVIYECNVLTLTHTICYKLTGLCGPKV